MVVHFDGLGGSIQAARMETFSSIFKGHDKIILFLCSFQIDIIISCLIELCGVEPSQLEK